jgi:hypothetical protein
LNDDRRLGSGWRRNFFDGWSRLGLGRFDFGWRGRGDFFSGRGFYGRRRFFVG